MITPEPMVKIVVSTTKPLMPKVIDKLYELNVMHMSQHHKSESLDIGSPLAESEKVALMVVKLRSIQSQLNVNGTRVDPQKQMKGLSKLSSLLEELSTHLNECQHIIKKSDEQLLTLCEEKKKIEILQALHVPTHIVKESKNIDVLVGIAKNLEGLHASKLLYESSSVEKEGKHLFIVFFKKEDREKIKAAIKEYDEIKIPAFGKVSVQDHLSRIEKQVSKSEREKKRAQKEIADLKKNWDIFLKTNEHYLAERLEKLEAPLQFASTSQVFIASGFVPESHYETIAESLTKCVKGKVHIEKIKVNKGENVPVKLRNSTVMKPFEFFLDLYSLPSYKEIDPTFMLFITFPIFFGFMLGDVGYGIIVLLLCLYLRKKLPSAKGLLNAMAQASLFTIFFGFLFGEYLGFEKIGSIDMPHLISRVHGNFSIAGNQIPAVLAIGVVVGFIHLNIGFILGFVNEWNSHGFLKGVYAKLSWLVLEVGLVLLVLSLTHALSLHWLVGAGIALVSVIMLYKGEGVQGLVELPSIFSNTLSYARLGAVGLSSVYLALVINDYFVMPMIQKGGIFIIFALLIGIVGHVINITLGVIGPFLHAVRLHYVEFFSKFFHGSGLRYTPFGEKKIVEG